MTQKKTLEPTVEDLLQENLDVRKRLSEAREHCHQILDSNDELRRKLQRQRDFMGPRYRNPMVCSDGRMWAYPFATCREETIRWFAGHAIGGLTARGMFTDDESVCVSAAALIAFDLWDELEKAFKVEHEKRAAAAEVVDKVAQDETSQNETRNGDAE